MGIGLSIGLQAPIDIRQAWALSRAHHTACVGRHIAEKCVGNGPKHVEYRSYRTPRMLFDGLGCAGVRVLCVCWAVLFKRSTTCIFVHVLIVRCSIRSAYVGCVSTHILLSLSLVSLTLLLSLYISFLSLSRSLAPSPIAYSSCLSLSFSLSISYTPLILTTQTKQKSPRGKRHSAGHLLDAAVTNIGRTDLKPTKGYAISFSRPV